VILGIGIDLCRVPRIRRSVERLGEAWIELAFSPEERDRCVAAADAGLAFAMGFASKEACAKALGTGFAAGVDPRDIRPSGIEETGTFSLCGSAGQRLSEITPPNHSPIPRFCFTRVGSLLSCIVVVEAVSNFGDGEQPRQ